MPVIGITGGIATGKSSFCEALLKHVEAQTFDADECARRLLDEDPTVQQAVRKNIHPDAIDTNGLVNRALLRKLVYQEMSMRKTLETILHPRVREKWLTLAHKAKSCGHLLLVDIPLLFETKAESYFDRIVVVACGVETQVQRLKIYRSIERNLAEKMIASQIPIALKISAAHNVIWNDGLSAVLLNQAGLFANILHDRYD